MDSENRKPLTEEKENSTEVKDAPARKTGPEPAPVYAERAETAAPELTPDELKALALAYAKYLAANEITPGEPTFTDSEEAGDIAAAVEDKAAAGKTENEETQEPEKGSDTAETSEQENDSEAEKASEPEQKKEKGKKKKGNKGSKASGKSSDKKTGRRLFISAEPTEEELRKIEESFEKDGKGLGRAASVMDVHDRMQSGFDTAARGVGRDFVAASHRITSTYRQSRRVIGVALLIIGILAAVVLVIFDRFTVYEYAYNGKTLGYVDNQEDVTDVLDIAGTMLTENSSGDTDIRFVANQNVTFKQVDARGKSVDDADIAVNKLVYMTDIETEAFGVYDGSELEAIIKSSKDAEELLEQTRAALSEPDKGMTLVSADFTNELDIRPVNVLLTSVQSNNDAMELMTTGGSMDVYHIVEEGETIADLTNKFGVDESNIIDEDNTDESAEIMQGDKVRLHIDVEPVSVKMVEKGKMKEVLEYETIKKESDEYYKGDTYTQQEGIDGSQIFSGTITKVSGEVTKRDGSVTPVRPKQDKIILVGTAERPKTAPTGTYGMPIQSYTLTSNFGYRWGRLHSGIDMAAPTGTPIFASDGGTIQRAGWYAGYGLCVEIDHENGRMTRYGHCSKLLVNVGDKVYQGQNIALVGNTGHSFGSHLHFEINLNGSPVDPRPHLGI